jgi:hypothetical protein
MTDNHTCQYSCWFIVWRHTQNSKTNKVRKACEDSIGTAFEAWHPCNPVNKGISLSDTRVTLLQLHESWRMTHSRDCARTLMQNKILPQRLKEIVMTRVPQFSYCWRIWHWSGGWGWLWSLGYRSEADVVMAELTICNIDTEPEYIWWIGWRIWIRRSRVDTCKCE